MKKEDPKQPARFYFTIFRRAVLLGSLAAVWMAAAVIQLGRVQASAGVGIAQATQRPSRTPTRTKRPEKADDLHMIPRACGSLVYAIEQDTGIPRAGLKLCGSGALYLFEKHPRDMVPYYQFRDFQVRKENNFLNTSLGPVNNYVIGFENYVGIDNCSQCGLYGIEPTWTTAPLTPYTYTPVPPTSTPVIPTATATSTASLAPYEMSETVSMFDVLFGTPTSTETPAPDTTLTPRAASDTQIAGQFSLSRMRIGLLFGIGAAILLLIYAYLVWIANQRPS